DESRSLSSFSRHDGLRHNFGVTIGRKSADSSGIAHEAGPNSEKVSRDHRYLVSESMLLYRDRTSEASGSDRLLDQKLTQIMIETLAQNENILGMRVDSNHDDF